VRHAVKKLFYFAVNFLTMDKQAAAVRKSALPAKHAPRNLRTFVPNFMLAVRAQGIGGVAETCFRSHGATGAGARERGARKARFLRSKKCAQRANKSERRQISCGARIFFITGTFRLSLFLVYLMIAVFKTNRGRPLFINVGTSLKHEVFEAPERRRSKLCWKKE
jgi:hypothetical protein